MAGPMSPRRSLQRALIVIDHGSRQEAANRLVVEVAARVRTPAPGRDRRARPYGNGFAHPGRSRGRLPRTGGGRDLGSSLLPRAGAPYPGDHPGRRRPSRRPAPRSRIQDRRALGRRRENRRGTPRASRDSRRAIISRDGPPSSCLPHPPRFSQRALGPAPRPKSTLGDGFEQVPRRESALAGSANSNLTGLNNPAYCRLFPYEDCLHD